VTCPACGQATEFVRLASLQVDVCPACKGVWFDKDELVDLPRRLAGKELAEAAAEVLGQFAKHRFARPPSYLQCPVCAGHLARRNYREASGILTNHCSSCGTWVDQQGMVRILRLLAQGRLTEIDERAARRPAPRPAPELPADPASWPVALNRPLPAPAARDPDDALEIVWVLLEILDWRFPDF